MINKKITAGYIGLGNMGFPICLNIVKAGYQVYISSYVYPEKNKNVETLIKAGAIASASQKDSGRIKGERDRYRTGSGTDGNPSVFPADRTDPERVKRFCKKG